MKILFVGSSGGHLAQMLPLARVLGGDQRWVMMRTPDAESKLAGEHVTWGFMPTTRNIPNLFRNRLLAGKVLKEFRPDLVVSTGAALAAPFFALARRHGARTLYVEVIDRISTRTVTGRLVYPFTDAFCVQWPDQVRLYPDAKVLGPVI